MERNAATTGDSSHRLVLEIEVPDFYVDGRSCGACGYEEAAE